MKNLATIYILIAASLWGTTGIFIKQLTGPLGFSSTQVILFRVAITALLMLLYLVLFKRSQLRVRLRDWWLFVGGALITVLLFNLCYYTAIRRVGMSMASVLLYTAPVFVMLCSALLFHEQITRRKGLALLLTIAGCVLVSGLIGGGGGEFDPLGVLFGLGAGLTYGLYSIFNKLALRRYSPLTYTFYIFAISALLMLPLADLPTLPALITQNASVIPLVLGLALCTCLLPYILYGNGLRTVEAGTASITATIELVVANLIGVLAYHEPLTAMSATGVVLVLIGAIIPNLPHRRAG